jgi:hypothetical protein
MGSSSVTDAALEIEAYNMLDKRLFALFQARRPSNSVIDQDEYKRIKGYSEELYNEIFGDIFRLVEEYLSCSPYDIFLALVPSPSPPTVVSSSTTSTSSPQFLKELAQRTAHITILHWRTWETLIYNNEEFESKKAPREPDMSRTQGAERHEPQAPNVITGCQEPEETISFVDMEMTGETMATKASAG